jgi:hypothetical protein
MVTVSAAAETVVHRRSRSVLMCRVALVGAV